MDTAHPNHAFISSEDVEGTNVYDRKGTRIGEVTTDDRQGFRHGSFMPC